MHAIQTAGLRDIADGIREREQHDPESYPAESIRQLFDTKVIAGALPATHGGFGWDAMATTRATFELAQYSPSAALIAAMPAGLAGAFTACSEAAPAAHRTRAAEQLDWAAAEYRAYHLMAACNSEKGAGGSLAATKTIATRGADGRFALTGEKILATGGTNAAWFFSTAKVAPEEMPGCGVVEFFFVPVQGAGVEVADDWDGFGMRSTESQTVRYSGAVAESILGFPDVITAVEPTSYWYLLFAAIPLGCARAIVDAMSDPAPAGPAMRLRLADALMRVEALEAYLFETASEWRPKAGPAYAQRILRTKSYVAQESTKLAAELFALSGGRHYRRGDRIAGLLADSFAGSALRPPLPLAIETLVEQFGS